MKDLTQGSILKHILTMAGPLAIGLITQTAYQLVDLFFVSRLGVAATTGLNTAGTATFLNLAITSVLGIGTMVAVAHATGRKDRQDANLMFNQSMALGIVLGLVVMLLFQTFIGSYLSHVAADEPSMHAGRTFIWWVAPAMGLMFPSASVGSSLRATGIVRPTTVISVMTVLLNIVLAPVLISGWGTGVALGVKGAGLATTISAATGLVAIIIWFVRRQQYLTFQWKLMLPKLALWWRILRVGLPAGAELVLAFCSTTLLFFVIRDFGSPVQAGVGIGMRVTNGILLPAMAIAFTVGPIAGQNFGARNAARVKETFRKVVTLGTVLMLVATTIAEWRPEIFVGLFSNDPETVAAASTFLRILSWTFVLEGVLITCSITFQSLGNGVPSLISYSTRFSLFFFPAAWLSTQPHFELAQLFYISNTAVLIQTMLSIWLLRREFRKRLGPFEQLPVRPREEAAA